MNETAEIGQEKTSEAILPARVCKMCGNPKSPDEPGYYYRFCGSCKKKKQRENATAKRRLDGIPEKIFGVYASHLPDMNKMVVCFKCKEEKIASDFYRSKAKANGLNSYCKKCVGEVNGINQKKNRLRISLRTHNMTVVEYDMMFASQGGKCAICKTDKLGALGHGRFVVDHDHKTNEVRGLLCGHCNLMLGYCKDNISILEAGAKYLEANQERSATPSETCCETRREGLQ